MLPLDLHVLGLPLAFILSQDQTLRCKKLWICWCARLIFLFTLFPYFLICQRTFLSLSRVPPLCNRRLVVTDVTRLFYFFILLPNRCSLCYSRCFRGCKGNQVFISNKCLWKIFWSFFFNSHLSTSARLRGAKVINFSFLTSLCQNIFKVFLQSLSFQFHPSPKRLSF